MSWLTQMSEICYIVGQVFCAVGGILVVLILSGLLILAACRAWERAIWRFGRIVYRRKIVREYEANRDEFLAFKSGYRRLRRQ